MRASTDSIGGYVFSSDLSTAPAGEPRAEIVVKIPSDHLDQFLKQLAALGTVASRSETGEDVTEDYVDQESRLRNLRTEERRLQEIMTKAGKLSDLLEVERELTRVRGEVEQIQGHLQHVDNQVAYATVSLSLTGTTPTILDDFWNVGGTAANAAQLFRYLVRFAMQVGIYSLVFLPFLVPAWWLLRRRRTRRPDLDEGPG